MPTFNKKTYFQGYQFLTKLGNIAFAVHNLLPNEPVHEKTNNLVSPPGLTQARLCSHRRRLEA